jgi:hypothetical protein
MALPEPAPNIGLELTAYSLRYAAASGSSSGLAFGSQGLEEQSDRCLHARPHIGSQEGARDARR